jgi:hypothetical protein
MFRAFPSLTRFSHGWTVTEKLDGSNSQVVIVPETEPDENGRLPREAYNDSILGEHEGLLIFACSRKRLINLGQDNYGFARFVHDNADEIIAKLGEGRHFGEWVGKGVNARGYNLDQKRFVLFNTHRWTGADLPERVDVVPVLFEGYLGEPGAEFATIMEDLKFAGSVYAPGYLDPEGIVMLHGPSRTLFKKTFDYDEQGKWAENEARRNASGAVQ